MKDRNERLVAWHMKEWKNRQMKEMEEIEDMREWKNEWKNNRMKVWKSETWNNGRMIMTECENDRIQERTNGRMIDWNMKGC